MRSFIDLDLKGKRVLLRVDFNVPVVSNVIQDYTKIKRLQPTIDLLKQKGAKIIIVSHFGRPKGEKDQAFSLAFMAPELEKVYGYKVSFVDDIAQLGESLEKGDIYLLQNIRFSPGEESNDEDFAKYLSSFADVYINDAFACSHRAHASIAAITKYLPSYAGLLLQDEVENLNSILKQDSGKLIAIIGGSKVSTKFKVLKFIDNFCNSLVICGAMANTMLAAMGNDVKDSLYEPALIDEAREFIRTCKAELILPTDVVVANTNAKVKQSEDSGAVPIGIGWEKSNEVAVRRVDQIKDGESILDFGPASCIKVMDAIAKNSLLVWNGPFGMFEDQRFRAATDIIARQVALLTSCGKLKSIAGGGDTLSVLEQSGLANQFSYISTAGGAFLEWLESGDLVGLKLLNS